MATKATTTTNPAGGIYQNMLNDFGFKYVFGRPKFLIAFLNELLKGEEKIKKVKYLNSEYLGKTNADRRAVFDILCTNNNGEQILLEMQNIYQKHFLDRSIFYGSSLIQRQGKKGKWDFHLKPTSVICILNFIPDELKGSNDPTIHSKLTDIKTKQVISDKFNYIYVTLPKFRKEKEELVTRMDFWLYTLIHSRKMLEVPTIITQDRLFNNLLSTIKINKLTPTDMRVYNHYEHRFDYDLSMYATGHLEQGLRQGREEGLRLGLEKGREENTRQIVKNALGRGFSPKEISAFTGLTLEQIEKLSH